MKDYYRVRLGKGGCFAEECVAGNFIGVDYGIRHDLTGRLPDKWREFNREFVPIYLAARPNKTKVAAGLACGALWTVSKGIRNGDNVLCPDGNRRYRVGEVAGEYFYAPGQNLPHRRPMRWLSQIIDRDDMSQPLQRVCGIPAAVCILNRAEYSDEIERLLSGKGPLPDDENVEDLALFAMEKHLEDFLVQNWAQTELGRDYDVYEEEGERVGQQYATDTGPIDILAVSKDRLRLLVVELKKGRASDAVVGQTLRYMGYVQDELAEEGQRVEGVVIALEDDQRIRRALAAAPNVSFYRYQISFRLARG